jgi:predicted 3-demethylubiquinone-9 3-methyltransferase (glyoxalase superfamily)
MARSVSTFLMFQEGNAEEAMGWYVSLFPGSQVTNLERWGPNEQGPEGKLKGASVTLCGHELRFFDSAPVHDFTFTPSISLFAECESEDELDRLFTSLSEGGQVFMPVSNYGFSTRFGWCSDRFGVSWQLNLA